METQIQKRIEPTFSDSFGHGWYTMGKYFLVLLLLVIILGLVTFPAQFVRINIDNDTFHWLGKVKDYIGLGGIAVLGVFAIIMGIFAFFYMLLVVPVIKFGADLMFVHGARGIRPQFETLVKGFTENYLHIILASLLRIALIMLGMILLLVPGIIVACRLAFVSYLVMDRKLDPIIAVEESWRLTRGHGWTIFGMAIVSFFIFIAGFIMFFVGVLPATIWVKSSFASLYEAVITEKNGAAVVAEG
ncbi:MAG: hypothetical protein JXR41_07595 [Bacteroidales bacterium]|nr:hypothetical protein [Bacteroidales bacterium]MBN2762937.1 hypothetical protein [Bacteroidales bacterium]